MKRKEDHAHWWKEAVIYQVYPRSFKDTNGDGVGDLKGIIEKIDYLASLGIDAVWLNPVYPSPNDDGGYDISDYTGIQPEFGDMNDFDALLDALHQRGIKLIMDLVLNHSSDEHPWFVESGKSKENPKRDYYCWKPGKSGFPPNNWISFFGGSAWEWDERTGEYYLHLFSKKQPDLNWENGYVRKEIKHLMTFWLDKGVDGLRLDVISLISKRQDFPDGNPSDFPATIRDVYANGPDVREYLKEMRYDVWNRYDTFTIGEGPGITAEKAMDYLDPEDGLKLIFHFDHMTLDQGTGGRFDPKPWSLSDFKAIFKKWDEAVSKHGWSSTFLGNHDYPRMVSRWGEDKEFRKESAKLLLTLLLCMRGTPFVFQGDEIGMTNFELGAISEAQDIETLNAWKEAQQKGISELEFLKTVNQMGRDNARTPMQWNSHPYGGFTTGIPWMIVNPNFPDIHVLDQENDPFSVLNHFRALVSLRKKFKALVYGEFEILDTGEQPLFNFKRKWLEEEWLIVLNFSAAYHNRTEDHDLADKLILSNYAEEDHLLRPWEANVYRL